MYIVRIEIEGWCSLLELTEIVRTVVAARRHFPKLEAEISQPHLPCGTGMYSTCASRFLAWFVTHSISIDLENDACNRAGPQRTSTTSGGALLVPCPKKSPSKTPQTLLSSSRDGSPKPQYAHTMEILFQRKYSSGGTSPTHFPTSVPGEKWAIL